MCLILFAWQSHADYPLMLAANRDEFYARPTAAAAHWTDTPDVVGGRDLEKHGSWLAVSARGRLAAVTNVRDGQRPKSGKRSRGLLVSEFVQSDASTDAHVAAVGAAAELYDGFNLLVAAEGEMLHFSNLEQAAEVVSPGIHGLSNHTLDTPWPKVERGKAELRLLHDVRGDTLIERLFAVLRDAHEATDDELPATGVSRDWERRLSSIFIATADYGTRASSVILVDRAGTIHFAEQNYGPHGAPLERRRFELQATLGTAPLA